MPSSEGAVEVLSEYWEQIGGRPEAKTGAKRKGRKSAAPESETGTPASVAKRPRKEKEWSPPPGSWEQDVDYVETVSETIDTKTGQPQRFAYLVWNNRKKSQHPLHHIYTKCPQKMLQYYESHL
jgi:chromobox protein 1